MGVGYNLIFKRVYMLDGDILILFPNVTKIDKKRIKETSLLLGWNLMDFKCINPDCSNLKKWGDSRVRFRYTCSDGCKHIMKDTIDILKKENNKQTNLLKYGVEHNSKCPEVIQKRKDNYFSKTGYISPLQNKELMIQARARYKLNTGYDHITKNPEIKEKRRILYFNKTGYFNPCQNPRVLQKRIRTNVSKFGVKHIKQLHLKNIEFWEDKEFWELNFLTNGYFDLHKCKKFFNCNQPAAYDHLKRLGLRYKRIGGTSLKEKEIIDFIKINHNVKINNRRIIPPKELDIFIPDLNLAIEYNGIYWHSNNDENSKFRHQDKSLACIKKGIRLLHIYEDEDPYIKIEEFLNWKWDRIQSEFDLDSGCYPLDIDFELLEPESRIVLKDRLLHNAGKIKLKGKERNESNIK